MAPFLLALFLLIYAFLSGILFTVRAKRSLGRVIHRGPTPLSGRILGSAVCVVVGLGAFFRAPILDQDGALVRDLPIWWVVLPLLSVLALWSQPNPRSHACGESGVRFGDRWSSYRDVESWRLTGEHLRCRLGGSWHAMAVPVGLHPELRRHLRKEAADREHEFNA